MRIVFATGNQGKAEEAKQILSREGMELVTLKELGLESDPEENGTTFAENARIKAMDVYEKLKAAGQMSDTMVLADDSGICIDHLGGKPGTQSARFMGHDTPYSEKNAAILKLLEGVKGRDRGANFCCHVTAVCEDGSIYDAESREYGLIAEKAEGTGGFGYDPIFWYPEFQKTGGCLTLSEKNQISHRAKALKKIKELLCQDQKL